MKPGITVIILCLLVFTEDSAVGETADEPWVDFTAQQWIELEDSIDRGLKWLSAKQVPGGAIGVKSAAAQPAHTALATMAFLSRGHQPGQGPYGRILERSIDYVLASQDNYGFFVLDPSYKTGGSTYSHAISGVMLAEVIGMTGQARNERISNAIQRGLEATVKLQQRHASSPTDRGGWRYIHRSGNSDADLSVSTWHLLFLRAAKNANFDVPESLVLDATGFVRRCFNAKQERFAYLPNRNGSISMTGAGTLCLFLAGRYDDPYAARGIETLKNYDFRDLRTGSWPYYTCYHSSQAGSQASPEARNLILKSIASFLIGRQSEDGSWPGKGSSQTTGRIYATSMAILSLTPSYQILPIYQQ
ncbi:MAG: terpene cyclase/mutase family protein [Verrucomicrobiales bacterium]|nr:terpene cyclase/mutase family protein [Verrucomicrobiales bacterium]